jgi:hypothetical protein
MCGKLMCFFVLSSILKVLADLIRINIYGK